MSAESNGNGKLLEFERHLWEATHIITGPVDAADYKTYLFPILFFKRLCDVWDEEIAATVEEYGETEEFARLPEFHKFVIPEGHHWKDVFNITSDVGKALKKAFREIEKANERLYGIFGDAQWTNKERLPDSLLHDLLDHYNRLPVGNKQLRQDKMGDAYEYLIKKFADQSNKKAGEFYTPRTVVRIMVNILNPKAGESV
jgi:type I restriction enzyme M protein